MSQEQVDHGDGAPGDLLDPLGDELSREILAAGAGSVVTASSLVDRLDASLTTVYRHLNRLVDRGLLREVTDVRELRTAETGYRTTHGALVVGIDESGVAVRHAGDDEVEAALRTLLDRVDVNRVTFDLENDDVRVRLSADDPVVRRLEEVYRSRPGEGWRDDRP
jgi:Fe2+ or Zn2+ uptake regulation protein